MISSFRSSAAWISHVDSDYPDVDAVPAWVVCCEMLAPNLRDIAVISSGRPNLL